MQNRCMQRLVDETVCYGLHLILYVFMLGASKQHVNHVLHLLVYFSEVGVKEVFLLTVTPEGVKVNKHAVLVSRHVVAVLVDEVQYDCAVLVQSLVIIPVTDNELKLAPVVKDVSP